MEYDNAMVNGTPRPARRHRRRNPQEVRNGADTSLGHCRRVAEIFGRAELKRQYLLRVWAYGRCLIVVLNGIHVFGVI